MPIKNPPKPKPEITMPTPPKAKPKKITTYKQTRLGSKVVKF